MAMRYLLDTNCCIYLFSGAKPKLNARVSEAAKGDIALSAITFAELMLGSARGRAPNPRALARLVEQMPVMPFDEAAAVIYGGLPFRRGSFDRLIGAHALALGLSLVTHNVSDFADMVGLDVQDWTL